MELSLLQEATWPGPCLKIQIDMPDCLPDSILDRCGRATVLTHANLPRASNDVLNFYQSFPSDRPASTLVTHLLLLHIIARCFLFVALRLLHCVRFHFFRFLHYLFYMLRDQRCLLI